MSHRDQIEIPEKVWYKRFKIAVVTVSLLFVTLISSMAMTAMELLNGAAISVACITGIQAVAIAYIAGDSYRKSIYDDYYGYGTPVYGGHHNEQGINTDINISLKEKTGPELNPEIPPPPYVENEKD